MPRSSTALVTSTIVLALLSHGPGCAHEREIGKNREAVVSYFQESYGQCRSAFLELANDLAQRYPGVEVKPLHLPSKTDFDLSIDTCFIPAPESRALLILTSGVHGVEGFTGSALQQLFMAEQADAFLDAGISLLLIHGINPWGFHHLRRVSENNVDLNRNFDTDPALFSTVNEGYTEVYDLLNPVGEVSMVGQDQTFPPRAVYQIVTKGMKNVRQAVLQGQYEHDKGLYFGGREFEPQRKLIEPLLRERMAAQRTILLVDLHTGYGERGLQHLFPTLEKNPERLAAMKQLFKGYPIDFGDSDDFYSTTGDFNGYVGKLVGAEQLFVPMVFEYGTQDTQTTAGSIKAIHVNIIENQGHHYGFASEDDEVEVQRRYREMYIPSSPWWRARVLEQAREIFPLVGQRLSALGQTRQRGSR